MKPGMKLGFFLSCEDFTPSQLIEQARAAEDAGFDGLWISDHFHPWNDAQGQAPFVWSVIGGLSQVVDLPVTTAVTCPTMRINPVIVAQAAATCAVMLEGRFALGIGSGEALNEHILGDPWPTVDVRLEMLEEAVEVMRRLWTEDFVNHRGTHYTVDTARIYTRPDSPPPIYMSGFGPQATDVAARIADGFMTMTPDADLLGRFRSQATQGAVAQAGVKVAFAPTREAGIDNVLELWPNQGLPGELAQILPSPRHFEQASELVEAKHVSEGLAAGPDPDDHVEAVKEYQDAGFDELYVGNIGTHDLTLQMIKMYGEQVLPTIRS